MPDFSKEIDTIQVLAISTDSVLIVQVIALHARRGQRKMLTKQYSICHSVRIWKIRLQVFIISKHAVYIYLMVFLSLVLVFKTANFWLWLSYLTRKSWSLFILITLKNMLFQLNLVTARIVSQDLLLTILSCCISRKYISFEGLLYKSIQKRNFSFKNTFLIIHINSCVQGAHTIMAHRLEYE